MKHRVFDDEFKKMAVELSRVKASVKEAAEELGLDASRLSKWRNNPAFNGGKVMMDKPGLSEEQQEIRRLKKALKNAELERDILKKAVGIFSKGDGDIQIYSPEQGNLSRWEDVGDIWYQ